MMAPERVVDDAASEFDAAMLQIANVVFDKALPTPAVTATFRVATRGEVAAVVSAFPDADWQFYESLSGEWWHGKVGPVGVLIEERGPVPPARSTEDALAALLGGDQ